MIDTALASDCRSRRVVDTKVTKKTVGGKWSEQWIVSRCGKKVPYTIDFITVPGRGTMISVSGIGK